MASGQRTYAIAINLVACAASPSGSGLRVIFLDIDGVLHPADGKIGMFHEACMQRLKRLVNDASATVVLSSSWRLIPPQLERARAQLKEFGIGIHDCTSQRIGSVSRVDEICEWVQEHIAEVASFAALDDTDLSDHGILGAHFVQTDENSGISDADVEKGLSVLQNKVASCSPAGVLARWMASKNGNAE
eukprot:TRINITY_DN50114_c0_g1_i2.p1 TRINITY_DN50114_c0_g1~~TRINITY_DN50114_c0_g1_i2.p1  ORF type:complete len:189 (+),score=35.85 TRINITY_DN50114_c0_g1_i2:288-854(+)